MIYASLFNLLTAGLFHIVAFATEVHFKLLINIASLFTWASILYGF